MLAQTSRHVASLTTYPRHIEVFDAHEMHFCIFFDQPTPGDIGYRTSASAYSRKVLAATFGTHIDDLPNFPFTKADPLIVNRCNPLDAPHDTMSA